MRLRNIKIARRLPLFRPTRSIDPGTDEVSLPINPPCPRQIGIRQIGAGQNRPGEIGIREIHVRQPRACQIEPGEPLPTKIDTAEIGKPERLVLCQPYSFHQFDEAARRGAEQFRNPLVRALRQSHGRRVRRRSAVTLAMIGRP